MPERLRADFLRELDAVLPFPDDRRSEIVEEIASHLDDAVADGLTESSAQRRLGEPADLARDLARPEQSAWRVLAGVGAALRSGIGHWLYGYLLGSLLVFLGALGSAALVQLIGAWLGTGWTLMTSDQGWNTMLVALAAAVGLYYAGRVIPDRLARTSRLLERDVRPYAVAATAVLALAITVLVVDAPQNWASVVALAMAPSAVALGALRPSLLPSGLRAYAAILVLALALPMALLALTGLGTASAGVNVTDGPSDRNLGHVGPWWPPFSDDGFPPIESSGWSREGNGPVLWNATVEPGALGELHDLRLEAWHSDPAALAIDDQFTEPFAVAIPSRGDGTLTAAIDTASEPGVGAWELVLTGVGPDDVRYVLDAGSGGNSTFTGSAWDWVTAVVGD